MKKNNAFFLILYVTFNSLFSHEPHFSHRQLIAIIDPGNEDAGQSESFCDGKIILPGPDSCILRNALRDQSAPIIVTKSVFKSFYNFSSRHSNLYYNFRTPRSSPYIFHY